MREKFTELLVKPEKFGLGVLAATEEERNAFLFALLRGGDVDANDIYRSADLAESFKTQNFVATVKKVIYHINEGDKFYEELAKATSVERLREIAVEFIPLGKWSGLDSMSEQIKKLPLTNLEQSKKDLAGIFISYIENPYWRNGELDGFAPTGEMTSYADIMSIF